MLIALPLLSCSPSAPFEEAWVAVPDEEAAAALRALPVGFAEGREGARVRVVGTPAELTAVAAAGFEVQSLGPPPPLAAHYPTATEVGDTLTSWAQTWPQRAERWQVGQSVEGQPLWAARLGPAEAPVLHRIVAGTHGDEAAAVSLALALGEALLAEDPGFEGLLDHQAVLLLPLLNPDGHDTATRFNASNVDLNRNFSHLWSPSEYAPGPEPFSEPETRAVRTLSLHLGAPLGLSLHSGATNLGYVWNHTTDPTVEEARLEALGATYTEACEQAGFYLTNGADWYTTRGDQNDWSYALRGTLDHTLEVSATKSPGAAELEDMLADHLPALAAWLAEPIRLQGQLVSAETGLGLEGTVQLPGATDPFATDPEGRFARWLEPGTWALEATAPGHGTLATTVTVGGDPGDWTLALSPEQLAQVRPEPGILSVGAGDARLTLPGTDPPDSLRLSRPGVDDLYLAWDGEAYPVSPDVLVPGPYTLSGDAWVAPRALFAGAHDDRVAVSAVTLEPDCVILAGHGFAEGTRAWALWGDDRAQVPLAVLQRRDGQLVLDRTPLPSEGTVDVRLVSQGREVAVLDVLGDPELDTAPPPDSGWAADTGSPSSDRPGRCATASPGPVTAPLALVALALLSRRTRRTW